MKIKLIGPLLVVIVILALQLFSRWQNNEETTTTSSSAITVADDNHDVIQAIATARSTVDDFVKRFEHPAPGDEGFSVKKKFEHNGKNEYIWLTNISYNDGIFTGQVGNEPEFVSNIRFGDTVEVKREDISDWMWLSNGRMHGGYTVRALLRNLPKAKADKLRAQFRLD